MDKHLASQDIASVNIKHAEFTKYTGLTLYGIVSFDNCTFHKWFAMYAYRNNFEPDPSPKTIQSFYSNKRHHTITISKCQFKFHIFYIYITEVVREIQIVQCDVKYTRIPIHVGNATSTQCNSLTLALVVVENSTLGPESAVSTYVHDPTSFAMFQFSDTDFHYAFVENLPLGGLVGFYFENCTFNNIDIAGIRIHDALHINIRNCEFRLKDRAQCQLGEGCVVSAKGLLNLPRNVALARFLFFPSCTSLQRWKCLTVHVENSVFVGSAGSSGGAISCKWLNLVIVNCKLIEKNKPATAGRFIQYSSHFSKLIAINVTFDTSETQFTMPVSIMAVHADRIEFENVHVMCPNSMSVVEEVQVGYNVHHKYRCEQYCKGDGYTNEAGNAVLQGKSSETILLIYHTCPLIPVVLHALWVQIVTTTSKHFLIIGDIETSQIM